MAAVGSFRALGAVEMESSSLTWRDHEPIMGSSLSQHTELKAEKELGETEEQMESAVKDLRQRLRELKLENENADVNKRLQERFENASREELVKFLRARKYDVSRALELMKGYAKYRMNYPDLFTEIDTDIIKQRLVNGQPGVLPYRDNEGHVVMFFRVAKWDPIEYPFNEVLKTLVCVIERLLLSQVTQINGVCLIEDFEGYNTTQVASVGLNDYRRMVDLLQGSFPCRFKGVHCIRQPWFFAKTYNLIKPLLKAKLLERIYIYGEELTDFYNYFPKDYLPKELGGIGTVYAGDEIVALLFDRDDDEDDVTAM